MVQAEEEKKSDTIQETRENGGASKMAGSDTESEKEENILGKRNDLNDDQIESIKDTEKQIQDQITFWVKKMKEK